jgi:endonuclease/exonuclease/phosphatase (EEP) superfamily protein YafD
MAGPSHARDRAAVSARGLLGAGVLVFGGGLALTTLFGFAGRLWWPLDLLAHFRVQYLVLSAAGAALLFLLREWRWALGLAACAGINALVLAPYLMPGVPESRSHSASAMTINVQTSNRNLSAVAGLIRDAQPDFVVVLEVDDAWTDALGVLRHDYPYGVTEARSGNFGIALLSQRPCVRCEIIRLGEAGLPSVLGEFEVEGSQITLVGTHPLPPVGAENARQHEDQLRAIGERLATVPRRKILLGDLNTTPWSARFRALTRRTQLRDSGVGYGLGRTWPVDDPLFGIPIDHALYSPGVVVVQRKRWRDIGSDHFPLQVYFAL